MNILVCVKQVPDTTEIKIDPVKNTLIRDGVPSIVNPFDAYALEAAARIKDEYPDTKIVALSMGPAQAKTALRECLAITADKAYLVSDRAFGGSDTLSTSYIISQSIKQVEKLEGKFDLIFCGKQAIDGDTAQVGPEIAEHLDYPQVTYGVEAKYDGSVIKVNQEVEDGVEVVASKLPCVVTFTKPSWLTRLPTIKRMVAANHTEIETLTSVEIEGIDKEKCGLKGSPTKVKKTFVPQRKKSGVKIQGKTAEEAGRTLFEMLSDAGAI